MYCERSVLVFAFSSSFSKIFSYIKKCQRLTHFSVNKFLI